jgi:hypothetical protein
MRPRRRRRIELSILVAALALVAAPSAGALEAGEEPGGSPTPGETTTEAPSGTTEPAPPSPGSTGWTPVGGGTGASGDGAAPIQRGSSLGSGGHSEPAGSTVEESAGPTVEEPSYAGSGSGSEAESSTPSTSERAESGRQAQSTTGSVPPPASTDKAVEVALGAATPLALPKSPQGSVSPSPPVPDAPFIDSGDQATSVSDALLSLAAIVLVLGLAFAAWRFGSHLWHRRAQRRYLEVRWSREADWETFVHQIEQTQAPGVPDPSGEGLQPSEVGPDPVAAASTASPDPATSHG